MGIRTSAHEVNKAAIRNAAPFHPHRTKGIAASAERPGRARR